MEFIKMLRKFWIENKKWIIIAGVLMVLIVAIIAFLSNVDQIETESFLRENGYDATERIDEALLKLENSEQKSYIIGNAQLSTPVVAICFEGLRSYEDMEEVSAILEKYNIKATFFFQGIDAAEDDQTVSMIASKYKIGNNTLSGDVAMEEMDQTDLVEDFCRSGVILDKITGQKIRLLKCNQTIYTDDLLEAAYASGLNLAVSPDAYLNYQSFSDYEMTQNYMSGVSYGSILMIKLEGILTDEEYSTGQDDPTLNKELMTEEDIETADEVDIFQTIEWICQASNALNLNTVEADDPILQQVIGASDPDTNMFLVTMQETIQAEAKSIESGGSSDEYKSIDLENLIDLNQDAKAAVIDTIYTTYPGIAFNFRGVSDEAALNAVLDELDVLNSRGTFFVTTKEIEKYPDRIALILARGQDIENGGVTADSALEAKSTYEVLKEIYDCDQMLLNLGIDSHYYMPGYGYVTDNIQEAVSAYNLEKKMDLITYSEYPIQSRYKGLAPQEIVNEYLPTSSNKSLRRGEIVYFRINSDILNESTQISELMDLIAQNYIFNGYVNYGKTDDLGEVTYEEGQIPLNYEICSLDYLMSTDENSTTGQRGRYGFTEMESPIYLGKLDLEAANQKIYTSYIGNPDISGQKLKGFEDTTGVDTTGLINTNGEKVVFLTFDDWGGDPVVTSILDVLDKHNVKGTFFVIGQNVDLDQSDLPDEDRINPNPNLLRVIAQRGHDIGSHNYTHENIDIDNDETEIYSLLNENIKSYNVMQNIIGDLDQLTLNFRPPQLEVSKTGLETVFSVGYEYSISGNISTNDYESTSVEEILSRLENLENGSILIFHYNNQSGYTAEALDRFLTENESLPEDQQYHFGLVSDYLQ
ncbi:polysaccharide deacetylase family protein [Eubacteriaceae bacterium ES2]|nr:polysaccharide deacetylase family protein [Eubacteriaceae bacterium ES2]